MDEQAVTDARWRQEGEQWVLRSRDGATIFARIEEGDGFYNWGFEGQLLCYWHHRLRGAKEEARQAACKLARTGTYP